jgi:general secretion pathway protein N
MSAAAHPMLRAVLAVVAVWSAGVLVAVEAGLGGRWSLHPDARIDPDQIPEVRLVSGVGSVAGFEDYASIVQRPLFNEDRRPPPEEASAGEEGGVVAEVPLNVMVTSIVLTAERQIAIVTDPESKRSQTVSVGAALEGDQSAWRLVELQPRSAVFEGPGGRSAVDLRVFDGQGGEPPTPVAQAPVVQPQAQAPRPGGEAGGQKPGDEGRPQGSVVVEADSPEARAEQIRRRIEERRRQMREEAERANAERGQ